MKTRILSANSGKELYEKIKKEVEDDFNPTLAIVFGSVEIGIENIRKCMKNFSFETIGASSSGEIIGKEGASFEGLALEKSVVVALLELNNNTFKTKLFPLKGKDAKLIGKEIGKWGKSTFKKPSFLILGSGILLDADGVLEGISKVVDKNTPIIGGIAGDDGKFEETFVFTKDNISNFGILATVFNGDKIEMKNIAANGWAGIGIEMKATSATGNVLKKINNKSAAKLYAEYLDIEVEEIPQIGVKYPLLLKRKDGYILRAVLGTDPEKEALILAGSITEGSTLMFSALAGTGVTENVKQTLKKYYRETPEADFILFFSCVARHLAIGPLAEEEIKEAKKLWKAPLIGFFTYGGFGRLLNRDYDFHNETISLTIMKEK